MTEGWKDSSVITAGQAALEAVRLGHRAPHSGHRPPAPPSCPAHELSSEGMGVPPRPAHSSGVAPSHPHLSGVDRRPAEGRGGGWRGRWSDAGEQGIWCDCQGVVHSPEREASWTHVLGFRGDPDGCGGRQVLRGSVGWERRPCPSPSLCLPT